MILPLLTPTTIRSTKLANRLALAPMSRTSADNDGTPTQAMADYYASFARGGFGMLIVEATFIDQSYSQSYAGQPGMVSDAHEAAWRRVVDAVKRENGVIVLQLMHAGATSQCTFETHAPSPVRPRGTMIQGYGPRQGSYDVPKELSRDQIRGIRDAFLQAVQRAERAGFDGVEIHCANGYLLDQFLTEETNQRTDDYGGTLENRLRLTSEIISAAKAATSPDFLTGVRLSQAKATEQDYFWPHGLQDAEAIFSGVSAVGSDYIHLASEKNGYAYHCSTRKGENLTEFARKLTGLPVIANGGLEDIDLSNDLISSGKADILSIGKAAMLNPDLPLKISSGQSPRPFTFDMFRYGVTIDAQRRWEAERGELMART